ncbi:MAG: hypothetical protein QOH66_893, partial [Actinomycetota bacterium]|nr:hypothetical protein [Actinomycetota bacterium]
LIAGRELAGFEVAERFYEIGSEAGYEETDAYLRERVAGEVSRGGR